MTHGEVFFGALQGVTKAEVKPLARLLEVPLSTDHGFINDQKREALWKELSYSGSNDFAYLLRGMEGVDYPEIVRDVCEQMGIKGLLPGNDREATETNEAKLIQKVFEAAWDEMSAEERRQLLDSMDLQAADVPAGGAAAVAAIAAILAARGAGFLTYRLAVVVANLVARALLGAGLSFGTNAVLAETISVLLGPVGWIISGSWLAASLAGPAYRKTVPAIIQVAALRQLVRHRSIVGIVGTNAKRQADVLKEVFGVDPTQAAPVKSGGVELCGVPGNESATLVSFAEFGDAPSRANNAPYEQLRNCHVLVHVIDGSVTDAEIKGVEELEDRLAKKIAVVVLLADGLEPDSVTRLVETSMQRLRLKHAPVVLGQTSAPGRKSFPYDAGVIELRRRIDEHLSEMERERLFTGSGSGEAPPDGPSP